MILGLIMACAAVAQDVRPPVFFAGNDELRQYLFEAAQNNPNLKARYEDWRAALEKLPQVTTLEDPMFGYTQFLQSGQYLAQLMIEQKFPWFGTLRTRGDKAALEADAALARFYAARNQLFAQVKNAYFEYAFLAESMNIIQSQAAILSQLEEITLSRYSVGIGIQADVLRIQTEKDKLDDQLRGFEQSRPSLSARLLEALGREAAPELDWPQPAAFPPPPPPAPIVLAQIRAANPDLEAMQRMVESWEKQVVLARKAGYPDITAGFGYMFMKEPRNDNTRMRNAMIADETKMFVQDAPMNGVAPTLANIGYDVAREKYLNTSDEMKDEITVSFKVNVPIWRKRIKAGIREAE
ncbi:MAG: TolC family protein, partial [Candidatus Hydrogenedentes bacterium]|nr:TolC family protein [Candidatus Hydrogenedentota bacterium]